MRVWIDITNSPHVVIFRPFIARMRARGHEVTVTSREFAQTIGLLERFGIDHTASAPTAGRRGAARRGRWPTAPAALVRFARRERFDLAVAHGSTDQPLAARLAGTPQVSMFDYEYAAAMHHWNGRLATRVLVPVGDPGGGARALRHAPAEAGALPGAEGGVLPRGPRDRRRRAGRAGPRPRARDRRAAPAAGGDALPPGRLHRPVRARRSPGCWPPIRTCRPWCCRAPTSSGPSSPAGRRSCPRGRSTGPSLVAAADLVVSAGGTMNREAAALGVPA